MRDQPSHPWPDPGARPRPEPLPSPLEWRVPIVLLILGLLIILGAALWLGGSESIPAALLLIGVGLAIHVPVGIATLFLVGNLFGIDFGRLGSAVLKLAAIVVFTDALAFAGWQLIAGDVIPLWLAFAAMLVGVAAPWYLLSLLFNLDLWDLAKLVIGLILIGAVFAWLAVLAGRYLDSPREQPAPASDRANMSNGLVACSYDPAARVAASSAGDARPSA